MVNSLLPNILDICASIWQKNYVSSDFSKCADQVCYSLLVFVLTPTTFIFAVMHFVDADYDRYHFNEIRIDCKDHTVDLHFRLNRNRIEKVFSSIDCAKNKNIWTSNIWCIKNQSRRGSVLLLCFLWFLLHQTLPYNYPTTVWWKPNDSLKTVWRLSRSYTFKGTFLILESWQIIITWSFEWILVVCKVIRQSFRHFDLSA